MKRLFGSAIAVLITIVFAGAMFTQAREGEPPQGAPQKERLWHLLTPAPQPFPSVYSGTATVLYAREGVHLANPFNVDFLSISLPLPKNLPENLEVVIREDFRRRGIPIPLPLVGGEVNLLLRIEATNNDGKEQFRMIVYFTPVTNVLFEK